MKPRKIFIGYDSREDLAYRVLRHSIEENLSIPIPIIPLKQEVLRRIGLYRRAWREDRGQKFDVFDQRPFSTEFTFTRFLVPHLSLYEGWSLFMDCDMLVKCDLNEVFDRFNDENEAVYVVKHNHSPTAETKMDNQLQTRYNRKNWSSFVLWNNEHPRNVENLTVDDVNTKNGSWLHQFRWLEDEFIAELPQEYNWLTGHSPSLVTPKVIHYTDGGPWFNEWSPKRMIDVTAGKEWETYYQNSREFINGH